MKRNEIILFYLFIILDKMVKTIENLNKQEFDKMTELEGNYAKAMITYKLLDEELDKETKTYIDDHHGISYSGSNIDIGGHKGYVTNHGIFKHYPNERVFKKTEGKYGCPSGSGPQVPVKDSRMYNREGAILPSDPKMIVGSRMKSGQACGKEGQNVHVTHVGVPESSEYIGCYTDKESRAISQVQPEGRVFNEAMCRQRANDLGKPVYGLQYVDKETGLAECYVGDTLSQAKKYGEANKPIATWNTQTQGTKANALLFAENGNISIHKISDNIDEIFQEKSLDIPVGGSVKSMRSIPLPYIGMDVSPKPTNSQNPAWKDTFSVKVNNDTLEVMRIDQGTGWGQNLQLKGKTYSTKNAIWSSNSIIGKCPIKFRKPTDTSSIIKVPAICEGAKLIMQDDGNLVVYDNKDNAVWASNTYNQIGEVKVDEWVKGTFKKRDFLKGGEILQAGEWIASKSGKNRAILQEDGNFVVYKSRQGCIKRGDNYYGKSWTNAVYHLKGSNSNFVGKTGYIDNNTELYEYPKSLLEPGTKYKKVGSYDSNGNTIKTIKGDSEIKISVGSSNNASKTVTLPDDNIVVDPMPTNRQNSSWRDRFSVKVEGRKLIVTRIDQNSGWGQDLQLSGKKDNESVESVEDCKDACNFMDDCAGFTFEPGSKTCALKDENMFPKGTRFRDESKDLYLRMPKVKNDSSCSNKVSGISSTYYSKYPKSKDKMSKSKTCNLERYTTPMRNAVERQNMKVQDSLTDIAEDMDHLKKQNRKYLEEQPKLRKQNRDNLKEMMSTHNLMKHRKKNTITVDAKREDSHLFFVGENYQYITYTICAIFVVIFMLKILPRVNNA